MQTRIRSVRQEQALLSKALRAEGHSWAAVAAEIRQRYDVNARVAFRLAHGWSQMQVAEEWCRRWPTNPKTAKNVSYWEQWPATTGYEPSLDVLACLAELYECSVAELVADCADFRHLDPAHHAEDHLRALGDLIHASTVDERLEDADAVEAIQNADIQQLARVAASWSDQIKPDDTRRSVLLKVGAALSLAAAAPVVAAAMPAEAANADTSGHDLDGIWRSRYVFYSDSRGKDFTSEHYMVLRQNGRDLTAESLPNNEGSQVRLTLSLDRAVVTGTWTERTSLTGHYRGASYHGTIQMLLDPLGRAMTGKWLGFSKDFKVNVGDWSLTKVEDSVAKRVQEHYHFLT